MPAAVAVCLLVGGVVIDANLCTLLSSPKA